MRIDMRISKFYILAGIAAAVAFAGVNADAAKRRTSKASGPSAETLIEQGREAFLDYDFEKASRLFAQAAKARGLSEEDNETLTTYRRQANEAENFLERVEQISIIDSITVPRDEFFREYRIPASAGRLRGAEALPDGLGEADYVFTNEGGDYKLWSQPDTTGYYRIMEASLLTDGKWGQPTPLSSDLGEEGDEIYPFMMADGVTLYYSDNGENSIGGYDIMVATRDAADGTFLQPQNLGFPYNSPYDDYLLAIDELNGVGWWATDRNQLDDQLTLYVFVTNDLRKNYNPEETEDITAFARIDDYIATQPEDADYTDLLATIRAIDPTVDSRKPDFHLPVGGGKVLTHFDELKSRESSVAMKRYLAAKQNLESAETALARLRRQYHDSPSQTTADRIRRLETDIISLRGDLKIRKSELYKTLK